MTENGCSKWPNGGGQRGGRRWRSRYERKAMHVIIQLCFYPIFSVLKLKSRQGKNLNNSVLQQLILPRSVSCILCKLSYIYTFYFVKYTFLFSQEKWQFVAHLQVAIRVNLFLMSQMLFSWKFYLQKWLGFEPSSLRSKSNTFFHRTQKRMSLSWNLFPTPTDGPALHL